MRPHLFFCLVEIHQDKSRCTLKDWSTTAKDRLPWRHIVLSLVWTLVSYRLDWIFFHMAPHRTPPPRNHYENNSPRIFLCNFGGRLRQNCVITKKLIPQEVFSVIGDRRDLRLGHVELREIYVTPKKIFLREFFCVIDYAKPSQSPRK